MTALDVNSLGLIAIKCAWIIAIMSIHSAQSMSIDINDLRATEKLQNHIHSKIKRQANDGQECAQADIVFVVDSSGSIKLENWQRVLNFTASMVESFPIGDLGARFGIVKYGNKAHIEFFLDEYNTREEYLEHIYRMRWLDQATNTSGGIYRMYNEVFNVSRGDRPQVPNIGIVITDGASNQDANLTIPRALEAKSRGITMFALGIGEEISMDELNGIATESYLDDDGNPVEFVFMATDFAALPSIRSQLRDAACEVTAECRVIADLLFILDGSGSVDQQNWNRMIEFVSEILDDLNIADDETHLALMTFSDDVTIEWYLGDRTENRASVREGLATLKYPRGTTNTFDALNTARTQVFARADNRPEVQDIIVLFTDGGSNNFTRTLDAARDVRLSDIYVFVVGVTSSVNMDELNEMASDPDDSNVFMATDFSSLSNIRGQLKQAMCNDIDECAGNPCRNGGVCRDAMNMYFCQCPEGYAGINCEMPCSQEMNINILLDSSASIGRQRFYQMEQFVKDLSMALPIDSEIHSSLGLAVYSDDSDVEFMMSAHRDKKHIVDAISLPWNRPGVTDTSAALDMMNDVMYANSAGANSNKKNVAIVITDGKSMNREATFAAARRLRESGVTVFAVGVGVTFYYDLRELNGIASDPDSETVFIAPDYDSLASIITPLVQAVCNEEDNCSPDPCNGGTCVDLVEDYRCECLEGRSGKNCDRECASMLDLVLLVDNSGSIRRERFNQYIKPMIRDMIDSLEISADKTRVAIATFSDDVTVSFHLNTYSAKEDVLQAVELLQYRAGKTNIADTLNTLRTQMFTAANGDRFEVPNICVLFTDGVPTLKVDETLPEAIQARVDGIHIIAVAMEMEASNLYLKGLVSDPDEANIFTVQRYSGLLDITEQVSMATCDDLNECNSNPCVNGECFNGLSQYICGCDDEYTGRTCDRRCTRQLDLALVLDASGSMDSVYDWQMQLAKEIVYGLNFAASRTRVAMVTYSTEPKVRFYLDDYFEKESVLNAISFLKESGRTGTASAIDLVSSDIFVSTNGDRLGYDNVVIVMTDGRSNINQRSTVPNAENLQNGGVRVMSVGVGNAYDVQELNGIASDPDTSNVFMVNTENDIDQVANVILDELCQ